MEQDRKAKTPDLVRPPSEAQVIDAETTSFRDESRRQSILASKSAQAEEDQAFIDSISILNDG